MDSVCAQGGDAAQTVTTLNFMVSCAKGDATILEALMKFFEAQPKPIATVKEQCEFLKLHQDSADTVKLAQASLQQMNYVVDQAGVVYDYFAKYKAKGSKAYTCALRILNEMDKDVTLADEKMISLEPYNYSESIRNSVESFATTKAETDTEAELEVATKEKSSFEKRYKAKIGF